MLLPVISQCVIDWSAQDRVAILAALAIADEPAIAGAVDVVDSQIHALAHPQSTCKNQHIEMIYNLNLNSSCEHQVKRKTQRFILVGFGLTSLASHV